MIRSIKNKRTQKLMNENFTQDEKGWLVYKVMGSNTIYTQPKEWYAPNIPINGRVITIPRLSRNLLRICAEGCHFAVIDWCLDYFAAPYQRRTNSLYLCRVNFSDISDIVVPVNTPPLTLTLTCRAKRMTVLHKISWIRGEIHNG